MIRAVLAGNPNVGKSTVFNALTGLRQHTGNWSGKTVETKTGTFRHNGHTVEITDLPGTYSLHTHSPEEAVAGDFLQEMHDRLDCVVIVCDGASLSRNLILVLQILSVTSRCVVCVNLMDEAEKRGITVDTDTLSRLLGCPVIACAARQKTGLSALRDAIIQVGTASDMVPAHEPAQPATIPDNIPDTAQEIAAQTVHICPETAYRRDTLLDSIFTGRWTAYPIMALLVLGVFWLTIYGAGYLSAGLEWCFARLLPVCRWLFLYMGLPETAVSFLTDGILATLTQVIAVKMCYE